MNRVKMRVEGTEEGEASQGLAAPARIARGLRREGETKRVASEAGSRAE